jgi:tetratricopeptide (TPR) repeat protein
VDWRWLLGTAATIAVLGASVVGVHQYQTPRLQESLKRNALSFLAEGNREEGVRRLRLYLASRPDDTEATVRLGMELSSSPEPRDWWDAQQILLREVRVQRATTPIMTALLKLHLRLGEKGEALRVASDLEKRDDLTSEGARLVAESYQLNKSLSQALAAARRSVEIDPNDLLSLAFYFPLVHESTETLEGLRGEIDRCVKNATDRPMVLLVAYTALRNAGDENAAEYLHEAVKLAPKNLEVLLMAGGEALAGNPRDAQGYFEAAYEMAPEDERVLLVYGRWLWWAGQATEAGETFRVGWKKKGNLRLEFAWRLAEILVERTPKSEELVECLKELVESDAYQPAYRFLRGRSDVIAGEWNSAENHLLISKRLLERLLPSAALASDREELLYKTDLGLSGVAYQKGDLPKAIRLAEDAHRRLPREFVPLVTLGQLFFEMGDLEKSHEAWAEAVGQPFRPAGSLLGLARTKLAMLNEKPMSQRDVSTILELIESAKLESPNDPNLTLIEAEALFAAGRESESLDELRASVQLFDRSPMVALSLVRLLIASGDLEEAKTRLAAFEKSFGRSPLASITRTLLLCRQGEYARARESLLADDAVFPAPMKTARFRLLGHLSTLLNDAESAKGFFEQAVGADADDDDAWVYRWNFVNDQFGPEAADTLTSQERVSSGDRSVRWRWADSVRAMERHRAHPALAAGTLAEHALALDENHREHWASWHVKGLEAEVNGRLAEALSCYYKAIARGPALPSLVTRAVRRTLAARQVADAQGLLSFVRRQRLALLEDQMLQAEIYLAENKHEGALAEVRSVMERLPAEPSNVGVDRQAWLAGMLFQLGQVKEADAALASLIKERPSDLRTWLLHQAMERRSAGEEDAASTQKEIEQLPRTANRDFLAAEIYLSTGQVERADELFSDSWKEGSLLESQWRTLIDFLRWRKDATLKPVVEQARERFPEAPWLETLPRS